MLKIASITDLDGVVKEETMNYIETNDIKFRSIITKIIVKNKSFMVNAKAYRSIKKNKLINILCKK